MLKPGKGVHLVVNEDIIAFLGRSFDQLGDAYDSGGGDAQYDEHPVALFNYMKSHLLDEANFGLQEDPWQYEEDSFGKKVYIDRDYPDGALRVTLILNKKNELRLDVRTWYRE